MLVTFLVLFLVLGGIAQARALGSKADNFLPHFELCTQNGETTPSTHDCDDCRLAGGASLPAPVFDAGLPINRFPNPILHLVGTDLSAAHAVKPWSRGPPAGL